MKSSVIWGITLVNCAAFNWYVNYLLNIILTVTFARVVTLKYVA